MMRTPSIHHPLHVTRLIGLMARVAGFAFGAGLLSAAVAQTPPAAALVGVAPAGLNLTEDQLSAARALAASGSALQAAPMEQAPPMPRQNVKASAPVVTTDRQPLADLNFALANSVVRISSRGANLRSAASLDAAVMQVLPPNTAVTVSWTTPDGWLFVAINGVSGYINETVLMRR